MPRKATEARCKVCGTNTNVKKYSPKGSVGDAFFYEKYTHRNGVVHYYMAGNRVQNSSTSEKFEKMIKSNMSRRNYRFKEIKSLFETAFGSVVNNSMISRNLERAIRSNLLERSVERNIIFYRKVNPSKVTRKMKISEMSLNWHLSGSRTSVNLFLYVRNDTDSPLTSIPFALPSGSSDSIDDLNLIAYDQYGSIDKSRISSAYTYPGQILISVSFNKALKPIEKNFVFLKGDFDLNDDSFKFSLPINIESFKMSFIDNQTREIHVTKRLLDGIKESSPEVVKRGTLEGGGSYTEVEFNKLLRGETVVVSW